MLLEGYSRAVRFSRVFADRCAFWSATGAQRGALSPVAALFLTLLIALIIPSVILSLAHREKADYVFFDFVTRLVAWFLLYRECARASHRMWFIAVCILALYAAAFLAPWIGLLTLCFLFLVRNYASLPAKASPLTGRPSSPSDGNTYLSIAHPYRAVVRPVGITVCAEGNQGPQRGVDAIALDPICEPYARLLFSERILRACTISLASLATLFGLAFVCSYLYYSGDLLVALLGGTAATILIVLFSALSVSILNALSRGSVRAACIVLVISGAVAVLIIFDRILSLQPELFVNGLIWYQFAALGFNISLISVAAMGSVIIVRRRNDVGLMRILRKKGKGGLRAVLLRVFGIILPHSASFKSVRSLVMSILAFCIEGVAFCTYLGFGDSLLEIGREMAAKSLPLKDPRLLSVIEAHYFAVVAIVCFLGPIAFVTTQMALNGAERIRRWARRASLRSAEDVMREDQRSPVLFLRDFDNDQVSLKWAQMPEHMRSLDPGIEQANLEEVLQNSIDIGPLVAIGRPEDPFPPIGASRKYVRGASWQELVVSLMHTASLIVVGVSESEGVVWEIEQLVKQGYLGKSVFIIPPEECWNRRFLDRLLSKLLAVTDHAESNRLADAIETKVGEGGGVVGVAIDHHTARLFISHRRPSQIDMTRSSCGSQRLKRTIPQTTIGGDRQPNSLPSRQRLRRDSSGSLGSLQNRHLLFTRRCNGHGRNR